MTRRVVVVGGGLLGSSIAFHLSRAAAGSCNITIVDPHPVGACATSRSAGLVVQMTPHIAKTRMVRQTLGDINDLETEWEGESMGYQEHGTLRLAYTDTEEKALRHEADILRNVLAAEGGGNEQKGGKGKKSVVWLGASHCERIVPWLEMQRADMANIDEATEQGIAQGGVFCTGDGALDPGTTCFDLIFGIALILGS